MGSIIANKLSKMGKSVIIIDSNEKSFNALTTDFSGFQVEGDATQIEILKRAKVEQADLLLALTDNDDINLTVAQVAKHFFNVPHAIARIEDPVRERIFTKLEIQPLCPTRLLTESLLRTIENIEKQQSLKQE